MTDTKQQKQHIGIVIVTFYPNATILASRLHALGNEVSVAVVDNTPTTTEQASAPLTPQPLQQLFALPHIAHITLHANTGIAHAQNEGIKWLTAQGCSHIVFFDQDSEYTLTYVQNIVAEYNRISLLQPSLGILGPRVINQTDGAEYHSVIHIDEQQDNGFIRRREIISSGSCIAIKKLHTIGMMDDALFIDYVDFEYCWRAAHKGLISGITTAVSLPHKVGNNDLHFPHGYRVIISAPFRYYYQYRNHLWLCRRGYVPMQWKINTGIKQFLRIFYFPFMVKGWQNIEKNMFKGIAHGLFKPAKQSFTRQK